MQHIFPKLLIFAALLLTGCSNSGEDTTSGGGGGGGGIPSSDANPQGLDFYLQDDDTYAVGMGNSGYLTSVVIPERYSGKDVTAIIDYGFIVEKSHTGLTCPTSITLPSTIKKIGTYAFESGPDRYLDRYLEEIVYQGTKEDFLAIEFSTNWINVKGDYEQSTLKIKFDDGEANYSEAFTQFGMSLNTEAFYAEEKMPTKNLYIGGTYVVSCYLYSKYFPNIRHFFPNFSELTAQDESKVEIAGNVITPLALGNTLITIKRGDFTKSISATILNAKDLVGEFLFEDKIAEYDGQYHQLDPVKNVPNGVYVYYDIDTVEFSTLERYAASNYFSEPCISYGPCTQLQYAYLYKEGFNVVELSATLKIS